MERSGWNRPGGFNELTHDLRGAVRFAHAGRDQMEQRNVADVERPELLKHGEGMYRFAVEGVLAVANY